MVPHCLRLLGTPSKAVVCSPTPSPLHTVPYDIFQSVFRCSKVIIVLFVSRVRPRLMQRFPTDVGSRESERQAGIERELTNNCFHLTRNWIRARQAALSIRQRHQYKCYPRDMDNASHVGNQTLSNFPQILSPIHGSEPEKS